ncbi:kinesin light chain [Ceratobasidium sp. AG-Ba]|nr:kinesin light chain [Ceratobasidium sp. AG-Ba]
MAKLALTYWAKGRYDEAEELQVKVLEARKQAYGEGHAETLANMNNLGSIYHSQGRYEQAEQLGKLVADGIERALGADHPHRIGSMRNLLDTYEAMGERRRQEYETLCEQIQELETRAVWKQLLSPGTIEGWIEATLHRLNNDPIRS